MQGERLRLIQGFTDAQRDTTRRALAEGIRDGLNPRAQARVFRESIGLTDNQWQASQNFRRALERANEGRASDALRYGLRDRRSDRSILGVADRRRRPFTGEEIDRMVSRYRNRYRLHRSEVIARTESLRAVHSGNFESYHQAVDEGHILREEVVREWVTAGDHRVRSSHVRLSGVKRRLDGTFPAAGGPLRYPGDPRGSASEVISCRCSLSTRLIPIEEQDFLLGVKVVDIGDYRVARGFSRRAFSTCPHRNMAYDSSERRIWCKDCERDVEPFDAFTMIVGQLHTAHLRLEQRKREIEDAEKHSLRSLAAKAVDKVWRKRGMVPACPACGHGLLPEDFKHGVPSMLSREFAEAKRRRAQSENKTV